jgi:uncharacterized damage-inducible protein DinB
MMSSFIDEYLSLLHELHSEIEKSLIGLPTQALDWTPGPETNSLAVLVVHLTGAERFWVGDVALGDPSNRVRAAEFKAAGLAPEALITRLRDADEYIRHAIESLSLADLEALRTNPHDGRQFSVAWCLLHVLEHTATHMGHIELTSQLWRQAHPED